jgi:hypothetical protein
MKIRMLEDHDAALDGVNAKTYRDGAAYLVADDVAEQWLDEGLAEEDTSAGPVENTSLQPSELENTSQPPGGETKDDSASLAKLTKPQLVAHAAALDPPLVLDVASKKDELLAAIAAHGAGDGQALEDLSEAELVAHAAALDPPLELDEATPKADLLAAIAAHEPAEASTS